MQEKRTSKGTRVIMRVVMVALEVFMVVLEVTLVVLEVFMGRESDDD